MPNVGVALGDKVVKVEVGRVPAVGGGAVNVDCRAAVSAMVVVVGDDSMWPTTDDAVGNGGVIDGTGLCGEGGTVVDIDGAV